MIYPTVMCGKWNVWPMGICIVLLLGMVRGCEGEQSVTESICVRWNKGNLVGVEVMGVIGMED